MHHEVIKKVFEDGDVKIQGQIVDGYVSYQDKLLKGLVKQLFSDYYYESKIVHDVKEVGVTKQRDFRYVICHLCQPYYFGVSYSQCCPMFPEFSLL